MHSIRIPQIPPKILPPSLCKRNYIAPPPTSGPIISILAVKALSNRCLRRRRRKWLGSYDYLHGFCGYYLPCINERNAEVSVEMKVENLSLSASQPMAAVVEGSSPSLMVPCSNGGEADKGLQTQTLESIRASGIVACLRMRSTDVALAAARAALDGGIAVLEVTMDTPNAVEVIATLAREYPDATIGAGTILSMEDAEAAYDVGVRFMMSPVGDEAIVRRFNRLPTLFIPGAMTPTEIVKASQWGARAIKVFPARALGGPDYIQSLKRPLANIPLLPANGVTLDLVERYLMAGAMAVILSDAIFHREAIREGRYDEVMRRAAMAVTLGARGASAS